MSASHSNQELPERLKYILKAFFTYYNNKEPPKNTQEMNIALLENVALKGETLDDHPNFEILKFAVCLHLNRENPQIKIDLQLGRRFLHLCENKEFVKSLNFLEGTTFDLELTKKQIYKKIAEDHYDVFASVILGIIKLNPDTKISKIEENDFEKFIHSKEDVFSLYEFRESALEIMTEALLANKGNTHKLFTLAVGLGSLFYDPNQEKVCIQINKHYGIKIDNISTPLSNIVAAIEGFYEFHEESFEIIKPKTRKNTATREELRKLRAYEAEEKAKMSTLEDFRIEIGKLSTELNSLKSEINVFQNDIKRDSSNFKKNVNTLNVFNEKIQKFRTQIENLNNKYAALSGNKKNADQNKLRKIFNKIHKVYMEARDYNLEKHVIKSIEAIITKHPNPFETIDPDLIARNNFEANTDTIDQLIADITQDTLNNLKEIIVPISKNIASFDDPETTKHLEIMQATKLYHLNNKLQISADKLRERARQALDSYNELFKQANDYLLALKDRAETINPILSSGGGKISDKINKLSAAQIDLMANWFTFSGIIEKSKAINPHSHRMEELENEFKDLFSGLNRGLIAAIGTAQDKQMQMIGLFQDISLPHSQLESKFEQLETSFNVMENNLNPKVSLQTLKQRVNDALAISDNCSDLVNQAEIILNRIDSACNDLEIELEDDQLEIYGKLQYLIQNLKQLAEKANGIYNTQSQLVTAKENIKLSTTRSSFHIDSCDPYFICTLQLSNDKTAKLYGTSELPVEDLALLPVNSLSGSAAIDQKTVPAAWIQSESLAPGETWPEADLQFKAICLFFQYCMQCEANPETQGRNPPLRLHGDLPLAMLEQIISCCEATNKSYFFDGINIDTGKHDAFPIKSVNGHNKFQIERTMKLIKTTPELAGISSVVSKGPQDNLKAVGDTIMHLARIDKPDYLNQFVKLGIYPQQLQDYVHPKSGVKKTPWPSFQHEHDRQADAPQILSDSNTHKKLSK